MNGWAVRPISMMKTFPFEDTGMKIFVDEEYGYRFWCWIPEQESMSELASIWDGLTGEDRAAFFFDPTRLGGKWTQIDEDSEEYSSNTYSGYLNINDAGDVRLIWDDANVY